MDTLGNAGFVLAASCGILLFVVFYVWRFVFKKSLRRLIMSFSAILVGRDDHVDPDAPIQPDTSVHLSEIVADKAETAKLSGSLENVQPPRPSATIPVQESGDAAPNTSDNGWPRVMERARRSMSRPFRAIRLRTENEQILAQVQSKEDDLPDHGK